MYFIQSNLLKKDKCKFNYCPFFYRFELELFIDLARNSISSLPSEEKANDLFLVEPIPPKITKNRLTFRPKWS